MEGHLFDMEGHLFDWKGHYFEKGHNFVTNYWGDEILIMCTSP